MSEYKKTYPTAATVEQAKAGAETEQATTSNADFTTAAGSRQREAGG